jgi:hypothetical protein
VSDLAKWEVRGPVRLVANDIAEWDLAKVEWRPLRHFNSATFHPDGKLDESRHYNPDGTIPRNKCLYNDAGRLVETQFWIDDALSNQTLYVYDNAGRHVRTVEVSRDGAPRDTEVSTYDSSGRKTTVRFPGPHKPNADVSYAIEGVNHAYGAPGAVSITIAYDAQDLPAEVLFHDAQNALVGRVIFVRDEVGRLLSDELQLGERGLFPKLEQHPESTEADRAEMGAVLAKVLGPTLAFMKATYVYGEKGRMIEQRSSSGSLGEGRTAIRYDEHDNPIEQTTEHYEREVGVDEHGELHPTSERSLTQHTRFEYQYDAEGNWTERVVWSRLEPNPNFQRSNLKRRGISYYVSGGR